MTLQTAAMATLLTQRRQQSLYRQPSTLSGSQGVEICVDGRSYLSFCSNDYLGLASDARVIQALQEGAELYGVGSGAAHLVTGHNQVHHELEQALARFTGRERALLFSSGYMANLGTISALIKKGDAVFEDRLNHASLLDGGLLSGARFSRYHHNDPQALQHCLQQSRCENRLVVTDGVFSMDGDMADLPQLARICTDNGAWLMVDDAHGLGVLGEGGGGCLQYYGMDQEQVPVLVGTLGKAFGTFGAFVAGSDILIDYLIQFARSYIYTTAMPPALARATLTSLEIIENEPQRRHQLHKLIRIYRERAQAAGLPLTDSTTPIQPLMVGDSAAAITLSQRLKQEGIMIAAIRPPTVPEGQARLRITLSANHSVDQVQHLVSSLAKLI